MAHHQIVGRLTYFAVSVTRLAGVVGIEPTLTVLETAGLPLTDTPKTSLIIAQKELKPKLLELGGFLVGGHLFAGFAVLI